MKQVINTNRINWIYYLDSGSEKVFLYGISLPTIQEPYTTVSPRKIAKIGSNKLYVFEIISEVYPIDNGMLDLTFLSNELPIQEKIIEKRSIIQTASDANPLNPESPVTSPVINEIFYTGSLYEYKNSKYLDPKNIEELALIAKHIADDTGQSFKKNYAKRLGCFEHCNTQPWAEEMVSPFEINRRNDREYFFKRTDYHDQKLSIHLIIYDDYHEILLDTIQVIQPGIDFKLFEAPFNGNDARYEYWIFNNIGELIDRNKFTFIKSINIGMGLMGNQYDITADNYTKKSPLKNLSNQKVSTVSHVTNMTIDADQNKIKALNGEDKIVHKNLSSFFEGKNNTNNGRWFNKGEAAKVVDYFNDITRFGPGCITFVDPYISKESLDYLLHLKNNKLKICILSCWDDNDAFSAETINNLVTDTKSKMNHYSGYNIPLRSICWHNLRSAEFHDRFILTEEGQTGIKNIYSLSNSLNNLLKKYSFSIVPLKGDLKRNAINYVDSLLDSRSVSNMIFPYNED